MRCTGISSVTIQSIVTDIGADDSEALVQLINKLRTRTRYKDEQILTSYLMSKGFRYGDVKEALENRDTD